eukprot:symbB.v1.2.027178.t1/scaffold2760.1/size95945/10
MKASKQLKQMHKLHTPSGKAFLKTFALYLVSQPRHQFVPATLHSSYSAMAIVEKATPGKTATVFVGNIPYDATEDDVRGHLAQGGKVESFRMVFDKETLQPKGYGFCDFSDPDTAINAIKILSEKECNGRKLRLDLADNELRGVQSKGAGRQAASGSTALAIPGAEGGAPRPRMPQAPPAPIKTSGTTAASGVVTPAARLGQMGRQARHRDKKAKKQWLSEKRRGADVETAEESGLLKAEEDFRSYYDSQHFFHGPEEAEEQAAFWTSLRSPLPVTLRVRSASVEAILQNQGWKRRCEFDAAGMSVWEMDSLQYSSDSKLRHWAERENRRGTICFQDQHCPSHESLHEQVKVRESFKVGDSSVWTCNARR